MIKFAVKVLQLVLNYYYYQYSLVEKNTKKKKKKKKKNQKNKTKKQQHFIEKNCNNYFNKSQFAHFHSEFEYKQFGSV